MADFAILIDCLIKSSLEKFDRIDATQMNWLSFEEIFVIYGSYHSNRVNKGLHMIFSPLVAWAIVVLLTYAKICGTDPTPYSFLFSSCETFGTLLITNKAVILILLHSAYLIMLNAPTGFIVTFIMVGFWISANYIALIVPYAWFPALLIYSGSLIAEAIGHGCYEKRSLGAFAGFPHSFFTMFCVVLEVMFYLGYRKRLKEDLDLKIAQKISEMPQDPE